MGPSNPCSTVGDARVGVMDNKEPAPAPGVGMLAGKSWPRTGMLAGESCAEAHCRPVAGWWAARVSMLHSASPNKHGAGVRCLYDSRGQLIEGRQERYWRFSRQASPYRGKHSPPWHRCRL